jgi:gluconolactonase
MLGALPLGARAAAGAGASVVLPGAEMKKLAGGFGFAEGPTSDTQGNVYFTDQPNDRILRWSTEGKLSTFMQPAGRANGMFMTVSGNLIACADEKNELWSIAPDKTITVLAKGIAGKYFNGPNDVWRAPDGTLYFTDPFYKRTWWDHDVMALDREAVYRLSPDTEQPVLAADGFVRPNGIIGTPDGKHLFVADIAARKTYRYDIGADGSLGNRRLFCERGSDGMTLDEEGNVYLTGKDVEVFDASGRQIDAIAVPERPANVSFGGKDHRTLFITARTSLYAIALRVKGANATK